MLRTINDKMTMDDLYAWFIARLIAKWDESEFDRWLEFLRSQQTEYFEEIAAETELPFWEWYRIIERGLAKPNKRVPPRLRLFKGLSGGSPW